MKIVVIGGTGLIGSKTVVILRQVRGTSTCQVKDAEISMMISGSVTTPTSNIILHA